MQTLYGPELANLLGLVCPTEVAGRCYHITVDAPNPDQNDWFRDVIPATDEQIVAIGRIAVLDYDTEEEAWAAAVYISGHPAYSEYAFGVEPTWHPKSQARRQRLYNVGLVRAHLYLQEDENADMNAATLYEWACMHLLLSYLGTTTPED